jgi:integrase
MRRATAPLPELIEAFFRANYDLAPTTERFYRGNLRAFVAFIDQVHHRPATLADLSKPNVDAYLKWRMHAPTERYPAGSAFATRAACVSLKRFASWLADEGIAAETDGRSLLRTVRRTKVDDDVRRPLSDPEVERLLAAATRAGSVARALIVFALGTGLRLTELRLATIADLDVDRGEFVVRPETSKFGRGRTVYLHPAIARELDRYLRERRLATDPASPLFPTRTGACFADDGFAKLFARLRRDAGLTTFSAHLLRHTWATSFMRADGASLLELKRQGGWQRWEMVERYSHAVPPRDRRSLPNPLQKTALSQPPSARVNRLSVAG